MWLPLLRPRRRGIPCNGCFRRQLVHALFRFVLSSALQDDDVIAYLLTGLGPDYDPFVTSMTTKSEALRLDDVFAHLMTFEARQLQHQAELQLNPGSSANYTGRAELQLNLGSSANYAGRGGQRRIVGVGIVVVVVVKVMHPLVVLVIVVALMLVLPARSAAK